MNFRSLRFGALAGVALAFGVAAMPAQAATTTTEVVRAADVTPANNWNTYTRDGGTFSFETGPAPTPAGGGSLQLSTPLGNDKVYLLNSDNAGANISTVDEMSYSTYRTAGNLQQVAAINLAVDVNGAATGGFTTLVFEPVYNVGQGAVVNDTWQEWDAYNGGNAIWWSSNAIPGLPNRDTYVPWSTIVELNPNAVILGYGVNQGGGNQTLETNVDALTLGVSGATTVYDFEATPPTADACKKSDHGRYGFDNQGQCVSYVNTRK